MLQTRLLLAWCSLYLISLCTVTGIVLQISPPSVVLLSQSPPKTTFLCSGISASDIVEIVDISLAKVIQNADDQVFANLDGFQTNTAPSTLRKPTEVVVGGGIDPNVATSSTLTAEFETDEMVCADAGTYMCSYTYKKTNNQYETLTATANLSIQALPSEVTLTARKGGVTVVGSQQIPYEMNLNESIQFTCNGKIGSDRTNVLRYRMSSVFDDTFNIYQGHVTPGPTSTTAVDCSYTSSSTMTYVIKDVDVNRQVYLAFKCFVNDQQEAVTRESSVFYIKVLGGTTDPGNPGDSKGGGPANAGAIAGGVVGGVVAIVIIVLLVYFLWYRRRSAGDTYRTKEDTGPDNPNIAPSTDDLYAKPAKDKNRGGHDNNGVDEDYNYRDADDYRGRSRGRENRGMDNDSYNSRDGSPTMHMGSGHIGTGV